MNSNHDHSWFFDVLGNFDLLRYIILLQEGRGDWAAKTGKLHLLKDPKSTLKYTTKAFDGAAANGHLEVIKWLHENKKDVECTENALDKAAAKGHLEVCKYIHAVLVAQGHIFIPFQRFGGTTGKIIQNSGVVIGESSDIKGTLTGTIVS
jgi:hypothetical protein